MSFYCDHCHFQNNEIQPAGAVQEQGSKYVLKLTHEEDLQRQVIKSDTAIFRIEDLDIEVPPGRGRLTNVEGLVSEVLKDLEAGQKDRKKDDPDLYEKMDVIIQALIKMALGAKLPFSISLDDPTGNSSIEPYQSEDATIKDKYLHKQYARTPQQNAELGLGEPQMSGNGTSKGISQVQEDRGGGMEDVDILEGQTYDLPVECPGCTKPAHMVLQMVNIPYFKQVVITSTQCDHCNYSTSDVKTGGEVPEKGKRIWLDVKGPEDLGRDILKSETCTMRIPECKVEVVPGTMGGRFTTVEGLLSQVRDDLMGSIFDTGLEELEADSMPSQRKKTWIEFFKRLNQAIRGEFEFTILMEDPLAGSYCQTFGEPGEDSNVRSEDYERTEEEEDHLGLHDMKTHLNEEGEYVKEPINKGVVESLPKPASSTKDKSR